jgi:hypothetical protein
MALQTAIPVSFEAYFPRGAFMVGEVEPVVRWSDDGDRLSALTLHIEYTDALAPSVLVADR